MADGDGAGAGAGAGTGTGGDGGSASAEATADKGTGAGAAALGAGQTPEWLGTLPEDLRGDATLSRYQNVEALGRAHIEAHKLAKSKLAIPGEGARPEDWNAVFDALGRPKAAADYKIPLPEGVTEETPMAVAFRDKAFELGLLPGQVEGAVGFFNEQIGAAEKAYLAAGQEEVDAVKKELGAEYEPKREAAKAAIAKVFDVEDIDVLDRVLGSGKLIRGAMKLAAAFGEHGRIDGEGGGGLGAGLADASGQIDKLFADKGWRDKYNAGDVETVKQYDQLMGAARGQALKAAGRG